MIVTFAGQTPLLFVSGALGGATYQMSRLSLKIIFMFLLSVHEKNHVALRSGSFLSNGQNLNKVDRGLLDDASYQISRL